MLHGTLRLTTPDGQVREYPLDTDDAVLGRATGNRIVVDHVSVSRRHALLVVEGGHLFVEDMNSATGTFIDGQQLEPNERTPLPSGGAVRFGDVEGRWLAATVAAPEPPPPAQPVAPAVQEQAMIGGDDDEPPPAPLAPPMRTAPPPPAPPPQQRGTPIAAPQMGDASQFIGTSLASPAAPVTAGQPTSAIIAIHNRGPVVDEISISVVDLPPGWVRVTRPQLSMLPGARDEVNIVIQVPKEAASRAGEHSFAVAVSSKEHRVEVRSVGRFSVLPFEGMALELKPIRSTKAFRLEIANEGNTSLNLDLRGEDDEAALGYSLPPGGVTVEPGETGVVPFDVRPAERRLFGKPVVKSFTVEAKSRTNQLRGEVQGQLKVQPPLEPWKWPALALIVLGVLALGFVGYRSTCSGGWPVCGAEEAASPEPTETATATATRTATATATATAPTTPTTPATATTAPPTTPAFTLKAGGRAEIVNSAPNPPNNTNCLAVRTSPERLPGDPNIVIRDGRPVRLCNGVKVQIIDGPTNDGVFYWWVIKDPNATETGRLWAAEKKVDGSEVYMKAVP